MKTLYNQGELAQSNFTLWQCFQKGVFCRCGYMRKRVNPFSDADDIWPLYNKQLLITMWRKKKLLKVSLFSCFHIHVFFEINVFNCSDFKSFSFLLKSYDVFEANNFEISYYKVNC